MTKKGAQMTQYLSCFACYQYRRTFIPYTAPTPLYVDSLLFSCIVLLLYDDVLLIFVLFSPPVKGKLSDHPFNITCPLLSMESINEWHVLNGSDSLSDTSLTKDSLVSPILIQSVYSNTNQTHST